MPILTPEERIGGLVGERYRIEAVLASGGMGVLFRGSDVELGRKVAIKFLKPHDSVDEGRTRRFLQEIRTTARLRHPHVVEVLDTGEDAYGVPYLVMELLNGRSLQQELVALRTLAVADTLRTLLPILAALARAHEVGVIHRDIKPDNIFLSRDAGGALVPKLLDFGVAKVYESSLDTRTGAMLGTPEYMAPEQACGAEVGPCTDIWALAVVIYRCLSGSTPFAAQTPAEVVARVVSDTPDPLELEPGLKVFGAVVERALRRDPAARYADVQTFARALVGGARVCGIPCEIDSPVLRELIGDGRISVDPFAATTFDPAERSPTPSARQLPQASRPPRQLGRRVGVGLALAIAVASGLWLAGQSDGAPPLDSAGTRDAARDLGSGTVRPTLAAPAPGLVGAPEPPAEPARGVEPAPAVEPAPTAKPRSRPAVAPNHSPERAGPATRRPRPPASSAEPASPPEAPAATSRGEGALEFETEW